MVLTCVPGRCATGWVACPAVRCPACSADDTRVVDSRLADEGAAVRRRRACPACEHRFTTFERLEEVRLMVQKRSGRREPFDPAKIVGGLSAATKGRPVSAQTLEAVAEAVESQARVQGTIRNGTVTSESIGRFVLDALRAIDAVAAVRFASVYKSFDDLDDFEAELRGMAGPASA
jgi:transcriptional repressor NrdR